MVHVNGPVPVPADAVRSESVGLPVEFQQRPPAAGALPSSVIVQPPVALYERMETAFDVVTAGRYMLPVVNVSAAPYPVPAAVTA